jgi:TnpA family transposase
MWTVLHIRELGRIERTIFMLEWLERRVNAGLNKGKAKNALAGFSSIA